MFPARAARNSTIDLLLALLLATGVAVSIWYFVGDGDKAEPGPWGSGKLKGEVAVRLGAESVGIPVLGESESAWYFSEWRKILAAENPATDDRLESWLAARPGVSNVRVNRRFIPVEVGPSRPDTILTVRYDREEHLGAVPIDWPAFGYRLLKDDASTRMTGQTSGPRVEPGHSRGILWLIAVACAHGALIIVFVLRGTVRLFRRRSPAEAPPWEFDTEPDEAGAGAPPPVPPAKALPAARVIFLVVVAAVVLLVLVVVHERQVGKVVPHATARGWVWFSSVDWRPGDLSRNIVYSAFLIVPLGVQLFFRYLLVRRWQEAGRPVIGVLLTAVAFAVLWLDAALVPLGLAVGGVLGWLAVRGVPVIGLFALHALVNGVLFGFLMTGTPPPDGHDQRLEGTWVQVDGDTQSGFGRIGFKDRGRFIIPESRFNGVSSRASFEMNYLAITRDRLLVGVGKRSGTFRFAFEGDELVFTPAHRRPTEPADRYRRK
jgi:hypothetical protein